jgi:O-antigen ligase
MKTRFFVSTALVLALALPLGVDFWRRMPLEWIWLNQLRHDLFESLDYQGIQWIWALCCGVYLALFALLQWQLGWRSENAPLSEKSSLLLIVLAAWAVTAYSFHHSEELATTDFAVLLVGVTIGQAVAILKSRRRSQGDSGSILANILGSLIMVLTMAALFPSGAHWYAFYRGIERWSGPWTDPNRCGLMMGTGMVIALGLAASSLAFPTVNFGSKIQQPVALNERKESAVWRRILGIWRWDPAILSLMAAIVMAFGLIRTYSRGSWLGTLLALGYLVYSWWKMRVGTPMWLQWIKRNLPVLIVIGLSVGLMAFWNFKESEQRIVRRTLSLANKNDFSWRNRLVAYEGAMQIMADKPLLGHGWDTPKILYNEFYKPLGLIEGKAIELNDYCTLGMTLGIPALACFVWCIYRRLLVSESSKNLENGLTEGRQGSGKMRPITLRPEGETRRIQWLEVTCRAGVIVFLVGFWFERALCFIGTGATFWILLELGTAQKFFATERGSHSAYNPPRFSGTGSWCHTRNQSCRRQAPTGFRASSSGSSRDPAALGEC